MTSNNYHKLYMRSYRRKYPERISMSNKLWRDKHKLKLKHFISELNKLRTTKISFIKPKTGEYAKFPTIAKEVGELHGCKYLENNQFCNQPKQPGKPYCPKHSNICYIRLKPAEEIASN